MSCATASGSLPPAATRPKNGNWIVPSVATLYLPVRLSCPKTRTSNTSPGPSVVSSSATDAALSDEDIWPPRLQPTAHRQARTTTSVLSMVAVLVCCAQAAIHLIHLVFGRVRRRDVAIPEIRDVLLVAERSQHA